MIDPESGNETIVGLSAAPWDPMKVLSWPTDGYDGRIHRCNWRSGEIQHTDPLEISGFTKEEWVELADTMIARWTAWKAWVSHL